jgi:hypothetical protein
MEKVFSRERYKPFQKLLAAVFAVAAYFGAGHCDFDIAILLDLLH